MNAYNGQIDVRGRGRDAAAVAVAEDSPRMIRAPMEKKNGRNSTWKFMCSPEARCELIA